MWNTWTAASGWTNARPAPDQIANFTVSGDGLWWFPEYGGQHLLPVLRPVQPDGRLDHHLEAYRLNRLGRLDAATAGRMAGKFAIIDQFVGQIWADENAAGATPAVAFDVRPPGRAAACCARTPRSDVPGRGARREVFRPRVPD